MNMHGNFGKNVQTTQEESLFGTEFEIDPVIGENGSIDLNYILRSRYQAAIPRWESLTSGSMPKMEAQWFDRLCSWRHVPL